MAPEQLRVLITNDDGYQAPGIRALAPAIAELGYDVLVVAPLDDQSGVGSARAAMVGRPIRTASDEEAGVTYTGIDGTPALAVTLASVGAFGAAPDVVVSGINRGHNIGVPIFHSGTVRRVVRFGGRAGAAVHPGSWRRVPLPALPDAGFTMNGNCSRYPTHGVPHHVAEQLLLGAPPSKPPIAPHTNQSTPATAPNGSPWSPALNTLRRLLV
jgi:5'-nucleotidase